MAISIKDPLKIGSMTVRNRLYRAPLLEGAGIAKDPSAHLLRHFLPNAEAGVGLIIMGTTVVYPEGKPSPGMLGVDTDADLKSLRPMTKAVTDAGAKLVLQLGHGGLYCQDTWHEALRNNGYVAPVPSPPKLRSRLLSRGARCRVMDAEEVSNMAKRFGVVAGWAREAGFSGVQLSASNGKLLHQFLSSTHNRRTDRYGGTVDRRFQFFREIRGAISDHAGEDFPVLLKYPAFEESFMRRGITVEDGIDIALAAEAAGFASVTPVVAHTYMNTAVSRGGAAREAFEHPKFRARLEETLGSATQVRILEWAMENAARKWPYEHNWNQSIYSRIRQALTIPVFAVGGIRTPEMANGILAREEADMVGVARPFYAQPDLPKLFLENPNTYGELHCEHCNGCIISQLLGTNGVCINPLVNSKAKKVRMKAAA